MDLRKMYLKDFLVEIYKQIKPKETDFDEFRNDTNVLIIRSASPDILTSFIAKARKQNPNIHFYIITHARDKEIISNICDEKYTIIEYKYEGNYQLSNLLKEIEYLKYKKIDKSVVLYNNRYGMGFDNIEKILNSINEKNIYAFNCYDQLFEIENPTLHIESLSIFKAMCDWFWEYMEQKETRSENEKNWS